MIDLSPKTGKTEIKSSTRGTTAMPSEAKEFSLLRTSAEVTGSFSFEGDPVPWIDSILTERAVSFSTKVNWSRKRRFINKLLRIMLWPIGPSPLPEIVVEYEIPRAQITRVENMRLDTGDRVVSVDFTVPPR